MKRSAIYLLFTMLLLVSQASAQRSFNESFSDSAAGSSWTILPEAYLTADSLDGNGNGWLRLTDITQRQVDLGDGDFDNIDRTPGGAFSNHIFDLSKGGTFSFDFTIWGGSGADGMALIFFDGNDSSYTLGGGGGYLGYVDSPSNTYAAVGLSTYNGGNYFSDRSGNTVAIRGSKTNGFPLIMADWLNENINFSGYESRPDQAGVEYRRLIVNLSPDRKMTIWVQFGKAGQPIMYADHVDVSSEFPVDLSNIKIALSAAFGGANNNHELKNFSYQQDPPVQAVNPTFLNATSAQLNGLANPEKASTTVRFLYGTISGTYTDSVTALESPLTSGDTTFITVSKTISGLSTETQYYFVVSSVNDTGYFVSAEKSFYTLATEPTEQSSGLYADPIGKYSATINFTSGNGNSHLVILSKTGIGWYPTDGVAYSNGYGVEESAFVVYSGSNTSIDLMDLKDTTDYYITVFEYNGSGLTTNYFTENWVEGPFTTLSSDYKLAASLSGFSWGAASWADFDGDGDQDVAVSGNGSSVVIYRNNGSGESENDFDFESFYSPEYSFDQPSSVWADLDLDGNPELIVAGDNSIAYFSFNGEGFNDYSLPNHGSDAVSLAVFDYDQDGDPDILVSGLRDVETSQKHAQIYRNNGNGNFQLLQTNIRGLEDGNIGIGDFNKDGFPDVMTVGSDTWYNSGKTAFLYFGNGTENFQPSTQSLPGVYRSGMAVADYNADGNTDIFYTGATGDGNRESHLLWGSATGVFTDSSNVVTPLALADAAAADIDGDGDADLLVSGTPSGKSSASTYFAFNNNGNFTIAYQDELTQVNSSTVSLVDFDNDGRMDAFVGGYDISGGEEGSSIAHVYRSTKTPVNSNPASPESFSNSISGNSVKLSWSAGSDNNTPENVLGYNVFLTYSDTNETSYTVVSPSYNTESDLNLLQNSGNTFNHTYLDVKRLQPGTYHWAVQTVDAQYGFSSFSAWNEFSIVDTLAPEKPVDLSYSETETGVLRISWKPNNDNNVAGYRVYIKNQSGDYEFVSDSVKYEFITFFSESAEISSVYYDVPNLVSGKIYSFKISAVNSDSTEGELSETLNAGIFHFSEKYSSIPTLYQGTSKWGDMNHDGLPDLVNFDGSINIFINTGIDSLSGEPTFSESNYYFENPNSYAFLTLNDYDNDGDLDVGLAGDYNTMIMENKQDSVNTTYFDYAYSTESHNSIISAVWADYDNDGDEDFVSTMSDSGYFSILVNQTDSVGGHYFTEKNLHDYYGFDYSSIDAADYDKDGDIDFAAIGKLDGDKSILFLSNNKTDSTDFSVYNQTPLTQSYKGRIMFADLNNDGYPDMIQNGAAYDDQRVFRIYRNNQNGTFAQVPNSIIQTTRGSLDVADINGDGWSDIVISGTPNRNDDLILVIYLNTGNFTFMELENSFGYLSDTDVSLVDVDADGDLDIFYTGNGKIGGERKVSVSSKTSATAEIPEASFFFMNENSTKNSPPNAPSGLSVQINSDNFKLSWASSSDAETPSEGNTYPGLSYNVALFSISENRIITSGNTWADESASVRILDNNGNAGYNTFAVFKNLPDGNYKWMVQGVDNGHLYSDWAESEPFNFTKSVPVELVSFHASSNNSDVVLTWSTRTETSNYGFEVERSADSKDWVKVGFVKGAGTTTESRQYKFVDRNITAKTFYRLKQIDLNGDVNYSATEEFSPSKPGTFGLSQNYPNPFNPKTVIQYQIAADSHVELKVFDLLGREVVTLVDQVKDAGKYSVDFNAVNLTSGLYFYRIKAGNFTQTLRMMVVK